MYFIIKNNLILVFATISLVVSLSGCSKSHNVPPQILSFTSPDQKIELTVASLKKKSPEFSITFNNKMIVLPSVVDLLSEQQKSDSEHELIFLKSQKVDETSILPWGQFSQLHNQYHSAMFQLVDSLSGKIISVVEFRVYDDAVAFRHAFETSDVVHSSNLIEKTHFKLNTDASVWSYNGEKGVKHTKSLLSHGSKKLSIPAALTSTTLPALAIQEASRLETGEIKIASKKGVPELVIVSQPIESSNPPAFTSWRVLQIADKAGDLITSQVLMKLSPENKIKEVSWIKAGKSLWDWRVRGQKYDDHTYDLDNESLRRMIEFSSENNMQYVMIDANWYGPEHDAESNPFTEIDGLNIRDLINQANKKGIGFILYLNDKASVHHDLDKLFETWASWGAAGVKYGFMRKVQGKDKVQKTLNIVQLAAKHKLLINFHDGPIVPSGLRRAWPNWLTREAVHAQADGHKTFQPSGFIEMAHVNALAGPLDMSNGFFKLNDLKQNRKYVRADVNSTVAGEVARSLIIYSGLIIFPDAPEEYRNKEDLFEFLKLMPVSWDESKVLSSDIKQHIVTARRSGSDWFVGAAINEQGGSLPIVLDFIETGKTYTAKIYADAPSTHYIYNREAYVIKIIEVKRGDVIDIKLAPGGGQVIWLTPKN